MLRTVKECYESRHALRVLMEVEIKNRISSTRLGVLWWVLDPLILLAIYTFVIQIVFGRGGPGYPLFILTGLVIWQAAAKGISQAAGTFSRNSTLIRTYSTPLFAYVLGAVLSNIFYALFGVGIVLVYNIDVAGWHTFYSLPLLVLLVLVILTISLPLACMGVWIKDTALAITYILRVAFYASPVLYGIDTIMALDNIPQWVRYLYAANPIGYVITAVRQVLLEGQYLDPVQLATWFAVVLVGVQAGILLLRKLHNAVPKVV